MGRQDTENLFRRYKGQLANVKVSSGEVYRGTIVEITNDYVAIAGLESQKATFVLFHAIESVEIEDATPS